MIQATFVNEGVLGSLEPIKGTVSGFVVARF